MGATIAQRPPWCNVAGVSVLCPQCDQPAAPDATACVRCGALLGMPVIDISKLALLDDRGPQPNAPAAVARGSFEHPGAAAFAPPGQDRQAGDAADVPLGVERSTRAIRIENQWQRDREAKQAVAALPPPPPPRKPIGGIVVAVALVAAVAAAIIGIVKYPRTPAPVPIGGSGTGISIRIVAHDPTDVLIDGRAAGKTPLTLRRPRATQPMIITTAGTAAGAAQQIIPDHDQVVDLSPR